MMSIIIMYKIMAKIIFSIYLDKSWINKSLKMEDEKNRKKYVVMINSIVWNYIIYN